MKLHRVVVSWSGAGIVGTAVNVLHFDGSEQAAPPIAAIRGAYDAMHTAFPAGVVIQVPNTGDSIEDTTGALDGVWAGPAQLSVGGSNIGANAAGVGACIGWTTGGIVTGASGRPRKVRGRTFLVPVHKDTYDNDGTFQQGWMDILRAGANALQAAGGLAVWHRPTTAGGSDGNSYGVISNRVRDKVAYLSSRRD